MFYTYAEKQGNIFFDGWKMRVVAFDSMRRYLYYTSNPLEPQQIVPPNVPPCPPVPAPTDTNTNTTPTTPAMPTIASNHSITTPEPGPVSRFPHTNSAANLSSVSPFHTSPEEYNVPAPEPCRPSDLTWSKKIKVDLIIPVAREHLFLREDSHLKEQDYYQVEIHGEYRTLQNGECPAPGPFLCPSGGLGGIPSRCCLHNEEYIRDPFFLRELYDSLRDQFTSLRQERERQALATGVAYNEDKNKTQTLRSPRGRGSRVRLVMRLRSEHEFRRFWFVVQSVLGYDKIIARPYRGLPPYDPRNGITFSLVPMYLYNTFKELEKTVIYTFLRVDVVGRSTAGELSVFLHGSFLCITHDTILLLRETGNIPRWVKLQQVKEFHYNYTCRRPYIAFISDPGAPDLVLIPQPPGYGAEAIECFDAALETLRIRHVVRDACLASLDIRRVIAIHASPAASVRRFVEGYEAQIGRHLNFDPAAGYRGVLSCPLPKEQLANVWREVQGVYAARDLSVVSRSAIPLYSNNTNEVPLTPAQLSALSWRLSRERASSDDIVGMSFGEVQHLDEAVEAYERRQQHHHHPHHHHHHRHNSHHHEHSQSLPSMGTATIPQPAFSATEYGGENSERHAESSTSRERSTFDGRPPISPTPSTPQSPYGIQSLTQDQLNEHIHAEQLQTPQLHSHPTPAVLARRTGEDVGQDVMAPEEADGACSSVCSSCSSTSSSREGYQVPGSRYLTKEEVSSGAAAALEVVEDQHAVMMSQTPLAANSTQQFLQAVAETHIDDLVQHSMTAMHRKGSGALASANSGTASNSSPQNSVGRRVSKHGPLHPPTTPGRRATTTTTKTNNNNSNTTHKLDT